MSSRESSRESWIECDHQFSPSLLVPDMEFKTKGSVVDMLLSPPPPPTDNEATESAEHESLQIAVSRADWIDCDGHLRFEDDSESEDSSSRDLFVPTNNLKHKGSVVDMLMEGPVRRQKEVTPNITVSPPPTEREPDAEREPEREPESRPNVRFAATDRVSSYRRFKTTMVDGEPVDEEADRKRVDVALRAEAFTFDKDTDSFTISLSNVEIVRQNERTGRLTIKVRADRVNAQKSGTPEDEMDDQYVGSVLEEILGNY